MTRKMFVSMSWSILDQVEELHISLEQYNQNGVAALLAIKVLLRALLGGETTDNDREVCIRRLDHLRQDHYNDGSMLLGAMEQLRLELHAESAR